MTTVVLAHEESRLVVWLAGLGPFYVAYVQNVRMTKWEMPDVPEGFVRARWSLPCGEKAVYRDTNARDSVHLYEYEDHWVFHVDRSNPDAGPPEFIDHALTDALHITAVVVAAIALLFLAQGK